MYKFLIRDNPNIFPSNKKQGNAKGKKHRVFPSNWRYLLAAKANLSSPPSIQSLGKYPRTEEETVKANVEGEVRGKTRSTFTRDDEFHSTGSGGRKNFFLGMKKEKKGEGELHRGEGLRLSSDISAWTGRVIRLDSSGAPGRYVLIMAGLLS